MTEKKPLSLYVHIPFCKSRCGYCDFNTYAGKGNLIPDYIRGLEQEIIHFSAYLKDQFFIHTIYFGGGTPSILPGRYLRSIIQLIKERFEVVDDLEISMEVNPNGITSDYMEFIRKSGINRISIGGQSANSDELKILDRRHSFSDVIKAVEVTKNSGITNISLDLIFGIPTQTMKSLQDSVTRVIGLSPQHLSIYGLSYHGGTPLAEKIASGKILPIDEDLAGDMYEWLMEYLPGKGFNQYEISNWSLESKIDYCSQHNMQYWLNEDYLGVGAGAHSFVSENRWHNKLLIEEYLKGMSQENNKQALFHQAIQENKTLGINDIIKETMMMGLRLTNRGIDLRKFRERFSLDVEEIYSDQIQKLSKLGLIEYSSGISGNYLHLSQKGCMLGNQVFLEFI